MYPDNYSYRAIHRNPFTGEHGVCTLPASHYGTLPLSRPIESPKHDLTIIAEEGGTRLPDIPDLLSEALC